MEEEEKLDMFVKKYKRDINCLTDENRATRFGALKRFLNELPKEKEDKLREKLFVNHMLKPLTYAFEDKIEKNRETALKVALSHIEKFGFSKDIVLILSAVISRLNATPFPEPSEEVRLVVLNLLKSILLANSLEVVPFASDLCAMLSKLLLDANPTMKEECSKFIGIMSEKMKTVVGHHLKPVLSSLVINASHQRSKVRRMSLRAIGDAVKTEHAPPLLKGILTQLKSLVNDKIQDVRKELYQIVKEWLTSFDITYLKMFEPELVVILLAGVGDEVPELSSFCVDILEYYGSNLKKLLLELHEDISQIKSDSFDEKYTKITSQSSPDISNLSNNKNIKQYFIIIIILQDMLFKQLLI